MKLEVSTDLLAASAVATLSSISIAATSIYSTNTNNTVFTAIVIITTVAVTSVAFIVKSKSNHRHGERHPSALNKQILAESPSTHLSLPTLKRSESSNKKI